MKNVVTREGYESFLSELEQLKGVGRLEAAEAIRTASEQGDLSENAEYDAAKEAQALLERRIYELEEFLKHCEIVDMNDDDNITIGKTIELERVDNKKIYIIKLVGNNEADPFTQKVSVASPVGKELVGKQVGGKIHVVAPDGEIDYIIKSVTIS